MTLMLRWRKKKQNIVMKENREIKKWRVLGQRKED